MRRSLLTAVLLVVVSGAATAQGKTTVEPALAPVRAEDSAPDPALERKVTLQFGYGRLHEAVAELERTARIRLRCGASSGDWRVRDIPVSVSVTDMPLGDLLRLLAGATHTEVTASRVESGPAKGSFVYTICRGRKCQQALDRSFEVRRKAVRDLIRWGWDALASVAGQPDEVLDALPRPSKDC